MIAIPDPLWDAGLVPPPFVVPESATARLVPTTIVEFSYCIYSCINSQQGHGLCLFEAIFVGG